jgi:hypothetical protein
MHSDYDKILRVILTGRKVMKQFRFVMPALLVLALFAGAAEAQKKTARKGSTRKLAATKNIIPPLDVRTAREKVSAESVVLNDFINKLGPIVQDMDTMGANNKPSSKTAALSETNKQKILAAVRNVKAGLATLETDFRTKAALQKYLPSIRGIADLASQSEDSVIANKFVASKEPLRAASQKLMDTLAVMPR